MENFEFKSQVCTAIEQSEKLLKLGLKKETADMLIMSYSTKQDIIALPWSDSGGWTKDNSIPAWSLSRLIELMPFNVGKYSEFGLFLSKNTLEIMDVEEGTTDTFWDSEDVYENVIASIEWLIKEGYFNKDYLEETK